jgi:hypothetical protein
MMKWTKAERYQRVNFDLSGMGLMRSLSGQCTLDENQMGQCSIERPFHFITVLWGKPYAESFLEYCVASLLAPGNLPALQTQQQSKFLIATLPSDWEYMNATPIFDKLREYVDPVLVEIPPCPKGRSACEHMGLGHKAACEQAYREKAYAVILTPDCMISDGTVRHLQEHAARGIELVWVPALRFAEESFLGLLRAWKVMLDEERRQTANALIISGADMVRAAINGLHTETLSYEWDASYLSQLPSAIWWRVAGENGILIYSLSWAPFLLDFAAMKSHDTTALENWTIDGDYVFKNLGPSPKIHIVQDSDEMFCSSWGPLGDRAFDLKPRYVSRLNLINFLCKVEAFRSAFYSSVFDPLKRRMFFHPLRWHANPINSRWRQVERRSERILHFSLGYGFVAFRPVTACLKLLTGQLPSWEAYQYRGIKRDAAGDHIGAAADFARAIRVGPANPALHFLRGVAMLHAAAPHEAAVEFEKGLKLDPNNATLQGLLDSSRLSRQYRAGEDRRLGLVDTKREYVFRLLFDLGCSAVVIVFFKLRKFARHRRKFSLIKTMLRGASRRGFAFFGSSTVALKAAVRSVSPFDGFRGLRVDVLDDFQDGCRDAMVQDGQGQTKGGRDDGNADHE